MAKKICDKCDGSGLLNLNKIKKESYDDQMKVGDLRRLIKDMDDDAPVFYQRIEDVYFEKHKWKADLLIPEMYCDEKITDNEFIRAFCGFKYKEGNKEGLCITAHY